MGWKAGPERFTRVGRGWISRSRFAPLTDVRDALWAVGGASPDWWLLAKIGERFTAKVPVRGKLGAAVGYSEAWVISVALARALGLLPCNHVAGASVGESDQVGASDGA
jgi:hypothetical protein